VRRALILGNPAAQGGNYPGFAMAAGTENHASQPGWLSRALHWRWAKAAAALVLALVAGAAGWWLRPSAQEAAQVVGPSIGIVANHRNVQASVDMVLTVGNSHSSQASTLRLTITPTAASRPVTFTVTFSNFPRSTGGTLLTPLSEPLATSAAAATIAPTALVQPRAGPRYADYYLRQAFLAAGSPTPTAIVITSATPLGEDEAGTQLRVAIPQIVGEDPGVRIPAVETGQILYAGSADPPGFTGPAFGPALLPGQSTFTTNSRSAAPLADFQVLSGDPPTTLLGSEWAWNGINGATVLAANVAAEDDAQVYLFWAGLALGLAGGALITAILEFLTVLGRKDPAELAALADQ
jgi:hypothetical protein